MKIAKNMQKNAKNAKNDLLNIPKSSWMCKIFIKL